MRIEVVYAETSKSWSLEIDCAEGTTVGKAIALPELEENFKDVPLDSAAGYAVWGRKVDMDHELVDGDRLEVLRPLVQDPMEWRRMNARTRSEQE